MAVKMVKLARMVVLTLCGVFLIVIPAISYLLALLGNYYRDNTKSNRRP